MGECYKVGDQPWAAIYRHHNEKRVPCPVCYGKLEVTLVLGNGDEIITPCGYCAPGYEKPRGWVTEYAPYAAAERVRITGVEIRETVAGATREYRSGSFIYHPEDLFDTEDEATARATDKAEAERVRLETQAEFIKADTNKNYAWNVGYHLRQATNYRKRIAYHERMAALCKERVK